MPRLRNLRPERFNFRPGHKAVWLPKFTITLLRTPKQAPNLATFAVPRRLNKLDLKDYLWHAYGVPVLHVRSRLCYETPVFGRPGQQAPQMKRWRRRVASKRMTVEMASGPKGGDFVWPDEIEDLSPWDKETYEMMQKDQGADEDTKKQELLPNNQDVVDKEGSRLAEQARALREAGREAWRPTWKEYGRQDEGVGVGAFDPGRYQKAFARS